jgi:hypothetical protein
LGKGKKKIMMFLFFFLLSFFSVGFGNFLSLSEHHTCVAVETSSTPTFAGHPLVNIQCFGTNTDGATFT